MSDFLDYLDDIYEELVDEFGHEIESKCIHEQTTNYRRSDLSYASRYLVCERSHKRKAE